VGGEHNTPYCPMRRYPEIISEFRANKPDLFLADCDQALDDLAKANERVEDTLAGIAARDRAGPKRIPISTPRQGESSQYARDRDAVIHLAAMLDEWGIEP